ncbi:MAG: superoxide dismutase family protein, partial [Variovorax sp.]
MYKTACALTPLLLAIAGCSSVSLADPAAEARLLPTAGSSTNGIVRFVSRAGGVEVHAEVRGLPPNSVHGFHVHENGDCSAPDAMSAGGHFNPGASAHGAFDASAHHAGDLPSLRADASGVARIDYVSSSISMGTGAANDVVGKGLIVHRDPDDFTTQPTGN